VLELLAEELVDQGGELGLAVADVAGDGGAELAGGLEAAGRIDLEGAQEDRGDGRGQNVDAGELLGAGAGGGVGESVVEGLALVERLARGAVVKDEADREEIGAVVDGAAAGLFGGHEVDVALHGAELGLR